MTNINKTTFTILLGVTLLAVGLWPTSPTRAQTPLAVAKTASLTTATDFAAIDVTGTGAAGVQLTGTWSGTVTFEAAVDDGTFVTLNMVPSNSATATTTATANGAWSANVGGYHLVRARFSTATSGTVVVTLRASISGGK